MLKEDIETYNPDPNLGLNDDQVAERIEQGLVNKTKPVTGKSIFAILTSNIVSSFNVLYFIVAILFIVCRLWLYLLFLAAIIPNIVIGIYWDLKARNNAIKNEELTTVTVIRNGKEVAVFADELVLDDVVLLSKGAKICADGTVLFGNVSVNESSLNGRNDAAQKSVGSDVYSSTRVMSGYAKMRVTSVGRDSRCESIYHQSSKSERPESPTLTSFKTMFIFIFIIVFIMVSAQIITNIKMGMDVDFNNIGDTSTVYIPTTPSGLLLISSIALSISIIRLKKKKIRVNELYSLEMLSKADVLCVDKTGTITDSTMRVTTIESLNASSTDQISQILSNLLNATKDNNPMVDAIKKHVSYMPTLVATSAIPFTSDSKYSGASFGSRGTFILGEIEHLNIRNKSGLVYRSEDYISKGYRVLCLGHSLEMIKDNKFEGSLEPIALIVLEDNIRSDAIETFKWFKERGTEIKVISGDDTLITSEVAKSVGIQNAEKYISLKDKTDEEVAVLAREYIVFGDAAPEQKEIIVSSLKKSNKNVAMVGDGINDVLALKQANCSIALASGCAAAKNVSHIVLENSEFSQLKDIVDEGNRVFGNLFRISSLFLTKTVATIALLLAFLIASWANNNITYPFLPSHMFIWEIVCIIVASIFLLFNKQNEEIRGKKFLSRVFGRAFFSSFILVGAVAFYFILYTLRVQGYVYFDISLVDYGGQLPAAPGTTIGLEQIITMSVVTLTVVSSAVVFGSCSPTNKYRWVAFGSTAALAALLLGLEVLFSLTSKGENNILLLAFNLLTSFQWIITTVVSIIAVAVYLFALKIYEFIKMQTNKEGMDDINED